MVRHGSGAGNAPTEDGGGGTSNGGTGNGGTSSGGSRRHKGSGSGGFKASIRAF